MAKVSRRHLPLAEQKELVGELCLAITRVSSLDDAVRFIVDLFTKQEIEMIAKRLKIANLLLEGAKYNEIESRLFVSPPTVAKVHTWLDEGGSGFRLIHRKTKGAKNPLARVFTDDFEAASKKRGKVLFSWPGMLLEELIVSANQRQKKRLLKVLADVPKKDRLYKEIARLLQNSNT